MESLLWWVDVGLVHFISKNNNLFMGGEFDDVLDRISVQYLSGWISWVNNHNDFWLYSWFHCLVILLVQLFNSDLPSLLLIEIIRDRLSSIHLNRGWIEWILWDRNHDTILGSLQKSLQTNIDSLGCPICKHNSIYIRSGFGAISSLDVIGNLFSNKTQSVWGSICSYGTTYVLLILSGSSFSILTNSGCV